MKARIIFLIVLGMVMAGCSQNVSFTVVPALTQSPTKLAEIDTPTLPTMTTSPTPTANLSPTWTPLPTWSSENGATHLLRTFEGSDQCRLPCWNGITPGITNWENAEQILKPLAGFSRFSIHEGEQCIFGVCNSFSWLYRNVDGSVYVALPENRVHYIEIQIFDPQEFKGVTLIDILNTYGLPSMILMDVNPYIKFEGRPEGATLLILLDYPQNKSVIVYHRQAELEANKYVSCSLEDTIQMMIFDDGAPLASYETLTSLPEVSKLKVHGWRNLKDVTDLPTGSFLKT